MSSSSPVVDLTARRARVEQAIAAVVAAPVRYVPEALLDALQGSWIDPDREPVVVHHLTVAR